MDAMEGIELSNAQTIAGGSASQPSIDQASIQVSKKAAFDRLPKELLCGIFKDCTFVDLLSLRRTCKCFEDPAAHFAYEEIDVFRTEASITNFYKLAFSFCSRYVRRVNIYLDHIRYLSYECRLALPAQMRARFDTDEEIYAAALLDQIMSFSQSDSLSRFRSAFTGLENLEEVRVSKLYPAHLSLFDPIIKHDPAERWSTSAYVNMLSLATSGLKQLSQVGITPPTISSHSRLNPNGDESTIVAVVLDAINERAQRRGVRGHHLKVLDITADICRLFMTKSLVMLGPWDCYIQQMRATQTTLHSIQRLRICMDPDVLSNVRRDMDAESSAALQAVLRILQANNNGVRSPDAGQPIIATSASYSRSSYLCSQIMQ